MSVAFVSHCARCSVAGLIDRRQSVGQLYFEATSRLDGYVIGVFQCSGQLGVIFFEFFRGNGTDTELVEFRFILLTPFEHGFHIVKLV